MKQLNIYSQIMIQIAVLSLSLSQQKYYKTNKIETMKLYSNSLLPLEIFHFQNN